jgi:lysophospholipase L1-like esterase
MRVFILSFMIWVGVVGAAGAEPLRILAVGDSVMAWQKWTGRDIPSVMGAFLDAQVQNEAVPGARFSNTSRLGRAVGFDVRAQYFAGPWDLVLMNGGANDFLSDCNCGDCTDVLDGLIADDLTGEVPAFIASVRARGAAVIWMGYYASNRSGQFAGCRPYLVEYDARMNRLAAQTPGVQFVDSEDAIDAKDRSLFAFDGIHPSPAGAVLIGAYLARAVRQ